MAKNPRLKPCNTLTDYSQPRRILASLLMEFVMFEASRDFIQAAFFLGLHALIVWVAVLSGLWLTRLIERLDAKRRRLDLRR